MLALVVLVVAGYFGFTKANPFSNLYELHAVVRDAQNLKPNAPVRIAGVEVGKVTGIERESDGPPAARVTMQLRDDALPLHKDARMQIRPRILLEGNFFVDLQPGSPGTGDLPDGGTIPISQTATSVTLPQVLSVLDRDVRLDLQTFLREYGYALSGGGARGDQPDDPAARARLPAERDHQSGAARRAAHEGPRSACCAASAASRLRSPTTRRP